MSVIIVDFEYTTWPGALESGWSLFGQHREIVQMGVLEMFDDFGEINFRRGYLARPLVNPILSDLFVNLTNIKQEDIDAPGVMTVEYLIKLLTMLSNDWEIPIICMNGDEGVIRENCDINGLPYPTRPWHRLRPFLEAQGIDLANLSSGDLHTLTNAPLEGHTHDALHDVTSMAVWIQDAKKRGVLTSLEQLPTGIPDRDPRSTPMVAA